MNKIKKRTVGIWCEHPFAIYDSKPIVEKYKSEGNAIRVYTLSAYRNYVTEYLGVRLQNIILIDDYKSKLGAKLTRVFELIFIPRDFSPVFRMRKSIKWSSLENQISDSMVWFKLDGIKVNKRYRKWILLFSKIKLLPIIPMHDIDLLISFTKTLYPYLLSKYNSNHISIMESWDHPGKEPYLISPYIHLCWNIDLVNEAKKIQGLDKNNIIKPLKFRYIEEFDGLDENELYSKLSEKHYLDLSTFSRKSHVVYPMCTSSKYYAFEGELKFVEDLAKSLTAIGKKLYVRPYPLAPLSDKKALDAISNVTVGYVHSKSDGSEVLDEKELIHKYLLLKKSSFIINVGTTFAFDAALAGSAVLQLQLATNKYGEFTRYSKGSHITKYLWTKYSHPFNGEIEHLKKILLAKNNAIANRDLIVDWLMNKT